MAVACNSRKYQDSCVVFSCILSLDSEYVNLIEAIFSLVLLRMFVSQLIIKWLCDVGPKIYLFDRHTRQISQGFNNFPC